MPEPLERHQAGPHASSSDAGSGSQHGKDHNATPDDDIGRHHSANGTEVHHLHAIAQPGEVQGCRCRPACHMHAAVSI